MNIKKQLYKSILMLSFAGLSFFAATFLYLSITFGWLSDNRLIDGGGMVIIAESDEYDIYIAKTEKYDQVKNGIDVYEGITSFKEALLALGKHFNNSDSLYTDYVLALELDNEVKHDNVYHLVPGSFGSFTLYIKPRVENDFIVEFDLELSGYKKGYDEDNNPYVYIPEDDQKYNQALDMLKGHIMFFGGRVKSDGVVTKFTNFLENKIIYNTSGKQKVTVDGVEYYKMTIYWEWPLLYSDIIEQIRSSEEPDKKYPPEVGEYVASHPEYYFASNLDSTDINDLSDGYNDGDQLIGDNIHFLVVTLK